MAAGEAGLRDASGFCNHLLPPGDIRDTGHFGRSEALVDTDRSFLVASQENGRLQAPVDERTGMPLPIAPRSDLNSVPTEFVNYHHGFHPRLTPVLRTRGGRALRTSRIQRVHREQHNYGERTSFHCIFQEGPPIPTDEAEQLGLCGLGIAGYLPDKVVDTRQGASLVRDMKDWEFRRLSERGVFLFPKPQQVKKYRDKWLPGATLVDAKNKLLDNREKQALFGYRNVQYGLDPIRGFITALVIEQDLSDVKPSLRRDFLLRHDTQAGLTLLGIASVLASRTATVKGESFNKVYDDLYAEGRLHPMMQPGAANLLMYKMGNAMGRVALLPKLRAAMLGLGEDVA